MGKFYEALGDELSLFVRQTAWLHASPRQQQSRNLSVRKTEDRQESRLERMRRDGIVPPMPPLTWPWMFETLMDIGPTEPGPSCAVPISWRTLDAWCNRTGVALGGWECRLIRRLSGDYLAESDRARDIDCPSPWATRRVEMNREAVSAKVASVFERLMASRAKAKG